nr:hypothetical protein [Jiangella alkaliphila]
MRTRPADSESGALPSGARLEQLDHTRQTVRDVLTGDTAGVERPHGQLGAGLADGLGGDDADRLADVDELARGQRPAVAHGADAGLALAGQDTADADVLDARGHQPAISTSPRSSPAEATFVPSGDTTSSDSERA